MDAMVPKERVMIEILENIILEILQNCYTTAKIK
jgi:hypothetical protein